MAVERRHRGHGNRSPRVSLATAKVVPVFLFLVVAYSSYVIVGPLCISYLINNNDGFRQIPAGLALPIIWFFLLLPVAITYFRLLQVVTYDAGYVPLGDDSLRMKPPPDFWMRDVFVCDPNGFPKWCPYCNNWKPDRAHHNQDTGRCILKMDHFCPWVGGVVGERSIKFFLQFLAYALVLSAYLTILMAWFVHKNHHHVHWDVALGLGGFFLLFLLGMVINSLHLASMGYTTVEHAGREQTMYLAVLLPPELQASLHGNAPTLPQAARMSTSRSGPEEESERPLTSEIDDPSHSSYFSSNHGTGWPLRRASRSEYWRGTVTYPRDVANEPSLYPSYPPRTFAILEAPPGLNPWDLGSPWRNFVSMFGPRLHHWLLPIRHSPFSDHTSSVSFYPLGPDFEWLLEEAALRQPSSEPESKRSTVSSRRRRKRRLPEGWQNGERPDGWFSEKEARRARKEGRRRERESQRDVIL